MKGATISRVAQFASLVLLVSSHVHGQVERASLAGTVTDTSGAVIPGVTVKVISEGTNASVNLETDAAGNNLPYLDEIIGKPKREDSVRLTALRTGQVNLIDALAFADVARFKKS